MTMDVSNRKIDVKDAYEKSDSLIKSDSYKHDSGIHVKNEALLMKRDSYTRVEQNYTTRHETTIKSENKPSETTEIPITKSIKRSFDVAFLMLPDEKLKQKRSKSPKIQEEEETVDDSDEDIEVGTDVESPKHKPKYLLTKQIFDDPKLRTSEELYRPKSLSNDSQRSAFTKVSLSSKETRVSPSLSISPDLSYQNSLSPSPPRPYQFPGGVLNSSNFKTAHSIQHYQNAFLQESGFSGDQGMFSPKNVELLQPNLNKIRPMLSQYRPDLNPYSYTQFPTQQDVLKMSQPDFKFSQDIRNPAAAILSSLLPPSLAALSLPAQNVCAKCNITFRMTSDLVYHMRSHHKNDATDYNRKRREDKLKCPVCAESFRERHHLTRHMTAHQDKDNDEENVGAKKKAFVQFTK